MTSVSARGVAALVSVLALLAGCATGSPPPAPLGQELADKVTVDGVYRHLQALQDIADTHGGNRADGSPGYHASVDYVAQMLRDKGFDVATPEFDRLSGSQGGSPRLTVGGRDFRVEQASLLLTTQAGDCGRSRCGPAAPRAAPPPTTVTCPCAGPSPWSTTADVRW